jgi:hypothetical protein
MSAPNYLQKRANKPEQQAIRVADQPHVKQKIEQENSNGNRNER